MSIIILKNFFSSDWSIEHLLLLNCLQCVPIRLVDTDKHSIYIGKIYPEGNRPGMTSKTFVYAGVEGFAFFLSKSNFYEDTSALVEPLHLFWYYLTPMEKFCWRRKGREWTACYWASRTRRTRLRSGSGNRCRNIDITTRYVMCTYQSRRW